MNLRNLMYWFLAACDIALDSKNNNNYNAQCMQSHCMYLYNNFIFSSSVLYSNKLLEYRIISNNQRVKIYECTVRDEKIIFTMGVSLK